MKRKQLSIIALLLCCIIGLNAMIPRKSNDVHANPLLVGGASVVASILISMGFIVTSEDAQRMATDIYTSLDANLKSVADIKGQQINVGGVMTPVNMTRAQYDAFVQAIANKFGWGTNPPSVYQDTPYGQCLTSPSGYSSWTSPYDIKTSKQLFSGYGAGSWTTTYGGFTYTFTTGSGSGGSNGILVTCPDGFRFRANLNIYTGGGYTTAFHIYAPCIYSNGSTPPDIKFFAWSEPGTYVPGGATARADIYTESVVGSGNFNVYNGSNAGPFMANHLGTYTAPSAGINQDAYLEAVNGIGQGVEDIKLNMTNDMSKLIQYNADTVKSIDAVNDSVINLGGTISNAFSAVGTTITNAVNAVTTAITTTLTNAVNGVKTAVDSVQSVCANIKTAIDTLINNLATTITNAIEGALTWAFVPSETFWTDTFEAIKTPIMEKYPMDITILSALSTSGDSFDDIYLSAYYGNGNRSDSAVVVKAKYINDNINWIRSATSCIWIFLLFVYVWKRFNGLLAGTNDYSVSQIQQNAGWK